MGFFEEKLIYFFFLLSRRISETGQRDQPASAGDSLGKEMLERNSYVPRTLLALPPNLPGWGRNRGASPLITVHRCLGDLGLQECSLQVACSGGWWTCRSWTQGWGTTSGGYKHPSPREVQKPAGIILWGPCSYARAMKGNRSWQKHCGGVLLGFGMGISR